MALHNMSPARQIEYLKAYDQYIGARMNTPEGGRAIKMINKTGAPSIKGAVVTPGVVNQGVILVPIDIPNAIGIWYDSGIADGIEGWVVVTGVAEVLFINTPARGQLARTCITGDSGAAAGRAISEAYPTAPFATDKHFMEIGHTLETKGAPGLALVNLHFN